VKGTWSGYVEKALETGISSHRGPTLGNLGEGSSAGDLEMDEGGSGDELPPSLFEEAPWRGPGGGGGCWGRGGGGRVWSAADLDG
jgi:hypothetical protein